MAWEAKIAKSRRTVHRTEILVLYGRDLSPTRSQVINQLVDYHIGAATLSRSSLGS